MPYPKLSRRSVLTGLGGAFLALPALEIMGSNGRAQAATIPKRFLVCFGGTSTGRTHTGTTTTDLFTPSTLGFGYDVKVATQPLADHGVTGEVSVVSGLETPWGDPGNLPPGGRIPNFHNWCYGPLHCGVRTSDYQQVNGPSADQIVGDAIGADTRIPTMAYRVQASAYGDSGNPTKFTMSYRASDSGGVQPITPKVSPQLIFNELFEGFVPAGSDPEAEAAAALLRQRRISALDLVAERTTRLMAVLGDADRLRLEQHLAAIRDLELRLANLSSGAGEGCLLPPIPGADAPIGASYSDEKTRGELIVDLIHMAFACDLSRAGSLMITLPQCGLNMSAIIGVDQALHDIGHSSDVSHPGQRLEQLSQGIAWHVDLFARLVAKLKDTPESDGSSLLEHSALVLLFEGGHGYDPQTNEQNRIHSTENMVGLIAGGAGGMTQGQHVATDREHPVALTATAMTAVGVAGGLGEIDTTIPEILS